jgi:hypothetical protein
VTLTESEIDAAVDEALGYSPDQVEEELIVIPSGMMQCQKVWKDGRPPCTNIFIPANSNAKYCPEHQPGKKPPTAGQPRPTSVTNNIKVTLPAGAKKTDDVAKAVEAGAAAMLGLLPVLFAAVGDGECSDIFTRQIPAIAHQLGEVARYHKGLEKFFAGAEGTGELFAWVGLAAVTLPALIAVVLHHNIVKGALAERLATISATLEAAGGTPA